VEGVLPREGFTWPGEDEMEQITRGEWGAQHGSGPEVPRRPVSRVVVHHSLSPDVLPGTAVDAVRRHIQAIERHHVRTNGWAAIGYNAIIDQDGRIWEGRGWGRAGAHAGNAAINQDSVGICFLIDGSRRDVSDAAWSAAREYIREGLRVGEIAPDYQVTGHRDHRSTTCPGDRVYAELDRLRNLTTGTTEVGRRVWSPSLGYIVVTRYVSDQDWSFVKIDELQRLSGVRAGAPLARFSDHP
jgi:peptidoglycan recognition protein